MNSIKIAGDDAKIDSNRIRARWIYNQLMAFNRRVRNFAGESISFDEESKELFGVAAPAYAEEYFKAELDKLDSILPGKGNVNDRFQKLANKFVIPKDKIEPVMKAAIAEARKRTIAHLNCP